MFVLDEADLLLLHEYEGDLQAIAPQVSQSVSQGAYSCWGPASLSDQTAVFPAANMCVCLSDSKQAGMHQLLCMHIIVPATCFSAGTLPSFHAINCYSK